MAASGLTGGFWNMAEAGTSIGEPVSAILDQSGTGLDLLQPVAAEQPRYAGLPKTLGAELLVAGDDFDDAAWLHGAGWSGAMALAGEASSLSQSVSLTPGALYLVNVSFERSAGSLTVGFGGGQDVPTYDMTFSQSNSFLMFAEDGNTTLELQKDQNFVGEIKDVSIRQVTETTRNGVFFDGIDDYLRTLDLDMTEHQSATFILSGWRPAEVGSFFAADIGGYRGTANPGAFHVTGTLSTALARDDATSGNGATAQSETTALHSSRAFTIAVSVDYTKTLLEDQVQIVFLDGDAPEQRITGTAMSQDTVLPDGPVTLGAAANMSLDMRGIVFGALLSTPAITDPQDLAAAIEALRGDVPIVGFIGDSTIAANRTSAGQKSNNWSLAACVSGIESGEWDVADPGDTIAMQKRKWQNMDGAEGLDAVVIAVGANDIKHDRSAQEIAADLQDLVDTVAADAPNAEIYVLAVTPCGVWLETDERRAVRDAVNDSIAGIGTSGLTGITPVMGYDGTDRAWAFMDDGAGNLRPEFDSNADGVHGNNAARWLMALEVLRPRLAADGLFPDEIEGIRVDGTARGETLRGGLGGDTVFGSQGDDTLVGRDGNDRLDAGIGDDSATGDSGADTLYGGAGADTLKGGDGADSIAGGNGKDLIWMGAGNDLYVDNAQQGALGSDTVFANGGQDTINGSGGDDVFHGQEGRDRIWGRLGNDHLFGGAQDDTLFGGAGDDTIYGGNGRDHAFLGDGDDLWIDNAQTQFGADLIQGGDGNDTIQLGGGADTVSGGAGADVFVLAHGLGADRIEDFEAGQDKLHIDATLWGGALDQARLDSLSGSSAEGAVLDFGAGDSLLLENLAVDAVLLSDIVLI